MRTLAVDTALEACQAALVAEGEVLACASEPLARGHAERLPVMVAEVMDGIAFDSLDRIAVTLGPGSFTGLRVGLAFAKGLGLALERPVIGLGTLEVLAASAGGGAALAVAAIEARAGQVYIQAFTEGGAPLMAPDLLDPEVAAARLVELWSGGEAVVVGPGAERLAAVLPGVAIDPRPAPDVAALARLAALRPAPSAPPRPMYLRAPDARTIAERQTRV